MDDAFGMRIGQSLGHLLNHVNQLGQIIALAVVEHLTQGIAMD